MSVRGSERKLVVMTTLELRDQLQTLNAERTAAALAGLDDNEHYVADLEEEIEAVRWAYVGAAVTEIATFRAQLSGPQVG
jgi:hypothetical protein